MIEKLIDYDLLIPIMDFLFHEHEGSPEKAMSKYLNYILKDEDLSIDKTIKKGEPKKIGERTIYPVIMYSTIVLMDKFTYDSVAPFALAVIENNNKYFISLDAENKKINELLCDDLWETLGL